MQFKYHNHNPSEEKLPISEDRRQQINDGLALNGHSETIFGQQVFPEYSPIPSETFQRTDPKICRYTIYSHTIKLAKDLRKCLKEQREQIDKLETLDSAEKIQLNKNQQVDDQIPNTQKNFMQPKDEEGQNRAQEKRVTEEHKKQLKRNIGIPIQRLPYLRQDFESSYLLKAIQSQLFTNRKLCQNSESNENFHQQKPNEQRSQPRQSTLRNLQSNKHHEKLEFSAPVTWWDLIKAVVLVQKPELYWVMFLGLIVYQTRFAMHVIFQYLFQAVVQGDTSRSYTFAIIIGLLFFCYSYFQGVEQVPKMRFSHRLRYGLTYVMVKRIMQLPQYSVRKAETGKIISLISADLNSVEERAYYSGTIFYIPIYIVSTFTLLIVRYEVPGLIGVGVAIIFSCIGLGMTVLNARIFKRINTFKDQRIRMTSEIINGIKFIKTYAWEQAFLKLINKLRSSQISHYYRISFTKGIQRTVGTTAGNVSAISIILLLYLWEPESLSTSKIFAILEIFMYLRVTLIEISFGLTFWQQTVIVLSRYASIINIKTQRMINLDKIQAQGGPKGVFIKLEKKSTSEQKNSRIAIKMQNVSLYWENLPEEDKRAATLEKIDLNVKKNTILGISGKIGSGKSTLIFGILEEIPFYRGQIHISGSVGYVEQEPLVFSMTIQENIIFGQQMQPQLYEQALRESCFKYDLKNLPHNDQTLVGQKGITLSGGQKTRLALARALYKNPQILILDDPFSAVDVKVGMQIFRECIVKMKGKRTVVLASHHVQYFELCDEIILLQQSRKGIQYRGSYEQIAPLIKDIQSENDEQSQKYGKNEQTLEPTSNKEIQNEDFKNHGVKKQQNFFVTWRTYKNFLFYKKTNVPFFCLVILIFFISEGSNVAAYRFLANYDLQKVGLYEAFDGNNQTYWIVIGVLFGVYFFLNMIKFAFFSILVLMANKDIHNDMIRSLMRSPIAYFDYTPSGQLISKFSNDFTIMDYLVGFNIVNVIQGFSITILLMVNIFEVNVLYIVPGLIGASLIITLFLLLKRIIVKVRQLDLVTKSPLFTNLSETSAGLIQIKLYGSLRQTFRKYGDLITNSARVNYAYSLLTRLFHIKIFLINSFSFMGILLIGIASTQTQEAGLYALAVVFSIQINDYFGFFLKQILIMESNMITVERVFSILNIESEAEFITDYDRQQGYSEQNPRLYFNKVFLNPDVKVKNLSMKYTSDLPLVLDGVDLDIKPGEKIGIVGRTGAGKSSIIQVLLRLTEPQPETRYKINSFDALKMGLHTLRGNISVIPQKSFFFKDTLRKNLDPFDKYSDTEIWDSLKESNLDQMVKQFPEKLETNLTAIQNTFSVGQQQLLSLCRVLLRKNNILILDEATSSVDNETDEFIQKQIKKTFSHATVLTIAHRLTTIADYDKVAVIDKGKVCEFGSPHSLINRKGHFWGMVSSAGNKKQKIIDIAREAHQRSNHGH